MISYTRQCYSIIIGKPSIWWYQILIHWPYQFLAQLLYTKWKFSVQLWKTLSISSGLMFSLATICRAHSVHAPCQWETTLHCNVVSHWLGAYTKWSLYIWLHKTYIISWYQGNSLLKYTGMFSHLYVIFFRKYLDIVVFCSCIFFSWHWAGVRNYEPSPWKTQGPIYHT